MPASGIASAGFKLSQLLQSFTTSQLGSQVSGANSGQEPGSFKASLDMCIAQMRLQTFDPLASSSPGSVSGLSSSSLDAVLGSGNEAVNTLEALLSNRGTVNSPSLSGRNTALADPEAAYKMMTAINADNVNYKAEFSELSSMETYLSKMQQEATTLGGMDTAAKNGDIQARLQAFADAYNGWIQRFSQDLQPGGLLAGTQAAQAANWELKQSVESIFNGAQEGLHGMRDLGFTIDPVSGLASVDSGRLDSVLAANKSGAIDAIQEFSGNFAKAAELLNSAGNFIPNQLDNLSRAIDYIGKNEQSLQAEFGLGDAAKANDSVAQALASYNAIYAATT